MQTAVPLACFLSIIRPPGIQFENALLQISPVDKSKCPFVRDSSDVGFQLYTRHNPTVYQELVVGDDEKLFASNFDFNDKTVLLFHAFMEQPEDGSGIMIREAYMQRGDTNVIMVDAHHLEAGPWYFTAAQNTWYIGRFAAQFIDYMVSRGLNLNNTHLVGHSLGAQSAGVAGSALQSGRVARITGLDPALPLFDGLPLEQRLDPSDAHFVDVIHTDAGIFGYKIPVGHVDFYPNGGQSPQPGCELEVVLPQQMLLNKFFCSHWRSYYFYTESVLRPRSFVGTECSSWRRYTSGRCANSPTTHMGYGKGSTTRGYLTFYLTNYHISQNYTEDTEQNGVDSTKSRNKYVRTKRIDSHEHMKTVPDDKDTITRDKLAQSENQGETRDTNSNIKESIKTQPNQHNRTQLNNRNHSINIKNKPKLNKNTNIFNQSDEEKLSNTFGQPKSTIKEFHDKFASEGNLRPDITTDKLAPKHYKAHVNKAIVKQLPIMKRQKRFLPSLKSDSDQNLLVRILKFLVKNRQGILPVITVVREINTIVKSSNGELSHWLKESHNYEGTSPVLPPISYTLELGNGNKYIAFLKKLLGLNPKGDRLTITGSR